MTTCPNCGFANPDHARFCMNCATALDQVAPAGTRKVVTLVFADVVGSTGLGERLDPEALRQVMKQLFVFARGVAEQHGGTVEKFVGDAVLAIFGLPVLHEDDALRAVRAADELRRNLPELNAALERDHGVVLELRIGVNTGEVVVGEGAEGQTLVLGDAANAAARLEQSAAPGEVLIGPSTYRLVRDAVTVEAVEPLALKGKAAPVAAVRLLVVHDVAEGFARRTDTPLVGRERHLALLREILAGVADDRACHLVTLLGPPGVGKTRLVAELVAWLDDEVLTLRGRCLPYGVGVAYRPLVELLREGAGIGPDDSPEVVARRMRRFLDGAGLERAPDVPGSARMVDVLSGLGGAATMPASAEETNWAVRRLFEGLSRQRPLVVVFEDLHWGEPPFLELVDHIAAWAQDAPLCLVVTGRPELLERRPGWGGGKLYSTTLSLRPLSLVDTEHLVVTILRDHGRDPQLVARVAAAAEGNPLFVEQFVAMLSDQGYLRDGLDAERVAVPPTIQALLAARLDGLAAAERVVAQRAAVLGRSFDLADLEALLPDFQGDPDELLRSLVRKQMLQPDPGMGGLLRYRFEHSLVRDAAYQSMAKELRAHLHEQVAAILASRAGSDAEDLDALVGHHLEQAHGYRREIGGRGQEIEALAARAATHLAVAGRRAYARADAQTTSDLLERALALAPEEEPARRAWLLDLGFAYGDLGDLQRAEAIYAAALEVSEAAGDEVVAWRSRVAQDMVRYATRPEEAPDSSRQDAERAVAELRAAGDELGLVLALFHLTTVLWHLGRFAAIEPLAREAWPLAERAGRPRQAADACGLIGLSYLSGQKPLTAVMPAIEELVGLVGEDLVGRWVVHDLGTAHGLAGDFHTARAYHLEAESNIEELGLRGQLHTARLLRSDTALHEGRIDEAESLARASLEWFRSIGDRGWTAFASARLAAIVQLRGDHADAVALAEGVAGNLPAFEVISRAIAVSVIGRARAAVGDAEQGERLGRAAMELIDTSDHTSGRAQMRFWLASTLEAVGRREDAAAVRAEGFELCAAKGNVALAGFAERSIL